MSYLGKAKKSLKSGRILFEAECYDRCASRCYYAMFQMAVSALSKLEIRPPREGRYSHDWVQASVARELIHRRKILPAHWAEALPTALEWRRQADYSEDPLGRKRAERMLKRCNEFVEYFLEEVLKDGQG